MKRKEVADVMGGKDEWANADSMSSEQDLRIHTTDRQTLRRFSLSSTVPCGGLQRRPRILLPAADSQCGRADDYVFHGTYKYIP